MSLALWNDLQTTSDSHYSHFEQSNDEESVLFTHQPHWGARETDVMCLTFPRTVKVFKDITTVPNITLNFAQMKDAMPDGDLAWSPSLSSSSIDADCCTPPLSSTPASVNSDLPHFTTNDFSRPVSSSSFNSPCPTDDTCNIPPSSEMIGLPYLVSFMDLPDQPEFYQRDYTSRASSPVSTICPGIHANYHTADQLNEQEEEPSAKRVRHTSSEPKLESPFASLPSHQKVTRIGKKASKPKKGTRMTGSRGPQSYASDLSKCVLELSSSNWVKLSPPSMTERTSPAASHPSLPPSLSPSATPESSNARKRKRAMTSPFLTPLQSPLPSRLLSVDCDDGAPSPTSVSDKLNEKEDIDPVCGYIHRDFITASAMIQRRSERTKAPISYVDCDEDVFERPARGKARTKAKASPNEFKAQGPRTVLNKSRSGRPKRPQNTNSKCGCPFQIICPIPFGRFSDVVRHLESNVLHTHAEKARWECPNCGSRLARSDSYKRHVNANACGKRAPTEKIKPVYSPEVEQELERIRNSDHPAVLAAKERL